MWSSKNSHMLLVGMQNSILEDSVMVSYKAKHPNYTVHQLSSLIFTQRSWKLCLHRNWHRPVYINFIIAKIWKQPRYSLVGEWVNKLWYIKRMEYYSALKRSELSSYEKTWRKFKCILLSERSQSEKATCCVISSSWYFQKAKLCRQWKDQWLWGRRWGRVMNRWSTEDLKGSKNMLHNTILVDTYHYTFVQTHRTCDTKIES